MLALILILFLLPFVSIGFVCGFLYRIIEQTFLIGYDCIANTYLKDLNKEIQKIQEIDSLKFNYDDKDGKENI